MIFTGAGTRPLDTTRLYILALEKQGLNVNSISYVGHYVHDILVPFQVVIVEAIARYIHVLYSVCGPPHFFTLLTIVQLSCYPEVLLYFALSPFHSQTMQNIHICLVRAHTNIK